MTQTTLAGTEADRYLAKAKNLLQSINDGRWIANGLRAGGGIAQAEETTKPIDQLAAAGLDWLTPRVQPLQAVHDRMALHATAIQTYADAWQRTGQKVDEIARQLGGCAATDTESWCGVSGDRYRARAAEIATALEAAATLCAAKSVAATKMGEVAADARRQVGELLTKLIQELISYVNQATAAQGGVTAQTMAEATKLIDAYAKPIADLERQLTDSAASLAGPGASGRANQVITDDQAIAPLGIVGQIYKDLARYLKGEANVDLPMISPPGRPPQTRPQATPGNAPPPWIHSGRTVAVNKKDWPYPQIIDPRTMQPIHFPGSGLARVPPNRRAAPLTTEERAAYIREFERRGHKLLPGARWEDMQIHHIRPREYGGTNTFDNLVPVQGAAHRELFNRWWQDY